MGVDETVAAKGGTPLEVLATFIRLGCTSFGGPVAHLGYFRAELVERRRWVDETTFADLLALCQFLPGPASSQLGIALGTARAGVIGGVMAWLGFTLPSALILTLFALGLNLLGTATDAGWLRGLQIVAVAVVAQAVWGMAKSLAPDRPRGTMALVAAIVLLLWPTAFTQIALIILGGLVGWRWLRVATATTMVELPFGVPRLLSWISGGLLLAGLIGLPVVAATTGNQALILSNAFFRAGSLVFGGGHVVLPLLEQDVVGPGWVSPEQFTAGYGAAQAVPGPLFTFAAYLGAIRTPAPNGVVGAVIALIAIFLPSFLLIWAVLPLWGRLRSKASAQATLRGVNAVVVGILLAALYQPVITSSIHAPSDLALALVAFAALHLWRVPPWIVVVLSVLVAPLIG
jgi:chromate transporter